jgi:hypothetical protein
MQLTRIFLNDSAKYCQFYDIPGMQFALVGQKFIEKLVFFCCTAAQAMSSMMDIPRHKKHFSRWQAPINMQSQQCNK